MKFFRHHVWHYLSLIAIVGLGAALRFWQLDSKSLWLDEVITALFSLGQDYTVVPTETFFSTTAFTQIFTFQPGLSCAQIAQTVAIASVHPPLFFCMMYQWMSWLQPDVDQLIWTLRALPALIGVGAIAAVYYLGRVAFSPKVGLLGAALMAVSPFAVYLSQEARHYTLPMLLIALALAGLIQIQQDLVQRRRWRPLVWLGWMMVNLLGLYVHYFFILALIAQIVPLLGWMSWQRRHLPRYAWGALAGSLTGVGVGYLPWILTLWGHLSRPETDWLKLYEPTWLDWIAPLYQTLAGWILMVVILPVENQPWSVLVPSAVGMLLFVVWLVWHVGRGARRLWKDSSPHSSIHTSMRLLAGFTGCILFQFFVIVYVLGKDLTVVPRYNFVYYPGFCILLAASLAHLPTALGRETSPGASELEEGRSPTLTTRSRMRWLKEIQNHTRRVQLGVLLMGLVSSLVVTQGLAFHKSYYPEQVAQNMYLEPSQPLLFVVSYQSMQEVALGLSFALELREFYPVVEDAPIQFAFLSRPGGINQLWQQLESLQQPFESPLNLWIVASSSVRQQNFPEQLELATSQPRRSTAMNCQIDADQYHRIGVPYQLYRCQPL